MDSDTQTASPRLILGTVQLGRRYGIANRTGLPARTEAMGIIARAGRAGIDVFDTAPNYGRAEELVGEAARRGVLPRPRVVSKVVTMAEVKPGGRREAAELVASTVRASLARLGMDALFGLICQYAPDLRTHPGLAGAMLEARDQGLVEHVGASAYHPDDARELMERPGMDLIQLPANLFDHRFLQNGMLARLNDAGVRVMVRSAYLQGLFFLDPERLPREVARAEKPLLRLRALSREMGMELDELALAFVKGLEGVWGVVLGMESLGQLERNLSLFSRPALEPAGVREVLRTFRALDESIINPVKWKLWEHGDEG